VLWVFFLKGFSLLQNRFLLGAGVGDSGWLGIDSSTFSGTGSLV
jgi:hypothetical protein